MNREKAVPDGDGDGDGDAANREKTKAEDRTIHSRRWKQDDQ